MSRSVSAACAAAVIGLMAMAPAGAESFQSLQTQRQAVFAQMLNAPADRALMSEYARLSVAMRDYEAAASTLERLLDLEPGNARARLDLAITYFALGNYPLAEYHLAAASASGGLGPADLAAVDAFRTEAERRDEPSRFSGEIAAGIAASEGDHGPLLTGRLTWRHDLGDANATDWVTEAAIAGYHIGSGLGDATTDTTSFRLRSGPELRLTGDAYGARLQPYVQLESLRYDDTPGRDYDAAFLGIAYQNPLGPIWTVFADAAIGHGELRRGGGDIAFHRFETGVTVRPENDWLMRLTLSHEREDAPGRDERSHGIRADYSRSFETPGLSAIPDWTAGGFASADWLHIDEPFNSRDETRHAAGLFLRGHMANDLFVETRATHLSRHGGNDRSATVVSMQLGWEF